MTPTNSSKELRHSVASLFREYFMVITGIYTNIGYEKAASNPESTDQFVFIVHNNDTKQLMFDRFFGELASSIDISLPHNVPLESMPFPIK